ncbi:MAG: hypothetical protein HKO89_03515 [Saprospiraceae bacterium]|nr:hypothetical protein [Saprospiraceae bacterium]
MLSFFRRNLFINYFFLLLFAIVLQAVFFFSSTSENLVISLPVNLTSLPKIFDSPFFQTFLTIFLITLQGTTISRYVINNRFSRALSVVPGACFILFASFVMEDLSFHPALLANLFFILAIGNLFRIYKKFHPVTNIFNAGLFLSVASLIYYPYFIFFIVLLLGLISLRNIKWLEFIQLIIGFLCGIFLVGVLLYANGHIELLGQMIRTNLSMPSIDFTDFNSLIKPVFTLAIILVLVFYQSEIIRKKNFDVIRKLELNYWMLLIGLFSVFFIDNLEEIHLLTISFPVSVLGGLLLEKREKSMNKEFIFLLVLIFYFILVFKLI